MGHNGYNGLRSLSIPTLLTFTSQLTYSSQHTHCAIRNNTPQQIETMSSAHSSSTEGEFPDALPLGPRMQLFRDDTGTIRAGPSVNMASVPRLLVYDPARDLERVWASDMSNWVPLSVADLKFDDIARAAIAIEEENDRIAKHTKSIHCRPQLHCDDRTEFRRNDCVAAVDQGPCRLPPDRGRASRIYDRPNPKDFRLDGSNGPNKRVRDR
jgi:hypothetical protein